MGNAQGTAGDYQYADQLGSMDVKKSERTALSEDDHILEKIIDLSNTLWSEYNENFLDKDFCNHVAVAYMDRLGKLPVKDLRSVYNNDGGNAGGNDEESEDQLRAVLTYNPKRDEKFIVDELRGQLTEFFLERDVDLAYQEEDNPEINVTIKGVKYINPRTKETLNGRSGRGRKQRGGANGNNVSINSLLANIDSLKNNGNNGNRTNRTGANSGNKKNGNGANANKKNGNRNVNTANSFSNKKVNGNAKANGNAKVNGNALANGNAKANGNVPMTNNINANNIEKELKNLQLNKPVNNKKNGNKNGNGNKRNGNGKKNGNDNKTNGNVEALLKLTSSNAKNNKKNDPLANAEVITKNVENLNNVLKQKMPNDGRRPNFQNSAFFADCKDKDKPCKLSKSEICKRITQHYIVRGNIIAAILTFLPHKDRKTGRYQGGFCHNRLVSLEKGTYCLPPDVRNLRGMETRDVVKRLLEYVNNFGKGRCKAVNGHFMALNPSEMNSLKTSSSQYNAFYFRYTKRLQDAYKNTMNELYKILVLLSEMRSINNDDLEALSLKVKDHLDMGMKLCQYNYVAALVSLIQADLNHRSDHLKEVASSLEKGLD